MNTMLKKILIALVVLIALFVIIIAMRPADFLITRTTTIAAAAEVVFAQVNDLHKWDAWSPWAKLDPSMKQTHEGASAGVGAIYSWDGNKEVGAGRMTITESRTNEVIVIKLEFLKPFVAVNDAEFTFRAEGNQTTVSWSMSGKNNFMSKVFCLFMDMDKMVGGDFEKGLASMKTIAEAAEKN
jgi:Polyketide cyclase / dehydrase and lipid transport